MDEKGHRDQGRMLDHQCQLESEIVAVDIRVTPLVVFVFKVFLPDLFLEEVQIDCDGQTVADEVE